LVSQSETSTRLLFAQPVRRPVFIAILLAPADAAGILLVPGDVLDASLASGDAPDVFLDPIDSE
jgi:hypothetical protein